MPGEPASERADEVANLLVRVYEIHETIIAETGGLPGLRDAPLLHAGAARPFATFGGKELYESDFDKAAALFHSLIKSHPFMDGSKRTAFAAAPIFLQAVAAQCPNNSQLAKWLSFVLSLPRKTFGSLKASRYRFAASPTSPSGFAVCCVIVER